MKRFLKCLFGIADPKVVISLLYFPPKNRLGVVDHGSWLDRWEVRVAKNHSVEYGFPYWGKIDD